MRLSLSRQSYNACLSCTCKFSKRIDLTLRNKTNRAQNWTKILLTLLSVMKWDLSSMIISNRDLKFLSVMWKKIFNKLNIKLWIITVYHSQSNRQFERFNQTVEIALQFLTVNNSELDWSERLSMIMFTLNKVLNAFIKLSSDKIVYDFKTKTVFSMLVTESIMKISWSIQRLMNR